MSAAVGVALVPTHDPDWSEAHCGVAADGGLVVCGWINHQAMVAPVVNQVPGQRCHGFATDTAPVHHRVQKDVDRGVPVVGLVLFAVLNHPAHRTTHQHRKANR